MAQVAKVSDPHPGTYVLLSLIVALFGAFGSVDSLWVDYCIAVYCSICVVTYILDVNGQMAKDGRDADAVRDYLANSLPDQMALWCLATPALLGQHGSAMILESAIIVAALSAHAAELSDTLVGMLVNIAILLPLVLFSEYQAAATKGTADAAIACNRRLLEHTTDGFGTLDLNSRLLSVSDKLVETFDQELQAGQCLVDILHPSEHARFRALLADGSHQLEPFMITCATSKKHFEVRFIPYQLEESSEVAFCVQCLGEARTAGQDLVPPSLRAVSTAAPSVSTFSSSSTALQRTSPSRDKLLSTLLSASGSLSISESNTHSRCSSAVVTEHGSVAAGLTVTGLVAPAVTQGQDAHGARAQSPPLLGGIAPGGLSCQQCAVCHRERCVADRLLDHEVAGGEPVVVEERWNPRFLPTPALTLQSAIEKLMLQMNLPRAGCCLRHDVWLLLRHLSREQLSAACTAPFGTNMSGQWQCSRCRAVHTRSPRAVADRLHCVRFCSICGLLVQPLLPQIGSGVSSGTASFSPGAPSSRSSTPGRGPPSSADGSAADGASAPVPSRAHMDEASSEDDWVEVRL